MLYHGAAGAAGAAVAAVAAVAAIAAVTAVAAVAADAADAADAGVSNARRASLLSSGSIYPTPIVCDSGGEPRSHLGEGQPTFVLVPQPGGHSGQGSSGSERLCSRRQVRHGSFAFAFN
jgi:hypothetical protein